MVLSKEKFKYKKAPFWCGVEFLDVTHVTSREIKIYGDGRDGGDGTKYVPVVKTRNFALTRKLI